MKKFVDTAPFIYLLENNPFFADKVILLLSNSILDGCTFETSVITLRIWCCTSATRREDVISKFKDLLVELGIELSNINEEIAAIAYSLRAKYQFLKGMDALQIATAINLGCEEFITNDLKLKRVEELKITVL